MLRTTLLALVLATSTAAPSIASAETPTAVRRLTFNGRAATAKDLEIVAQLEKLSGIAAPAGDYWYDARSGAAGRWGGPTFGFLPPGLALGGALPANASGGGNGRLSGVFINGRELHPIDVQVLVSIYGKALPGRWWVDGQGNAGPEGGPMQMNLIQLARQLNPKAANDYYRRDGKGGNAWGAGGCRGGRIVTGSGYDKKTIDYDVCP
jgi:hypothetical protein